MFNEVEQKIENARILDGLEEQLVIALFAPAEKAGFFEFTGMPWRDPTNTHRTDALLDQLPLLSEFYQVKRPSLSAALWSIADAGRYFRRQRPLLSRLGESKKKNDQMFFGVRALVANAVVKYLNGTASTTATLEGMSNLLRYRSEFEKAIRELSTVAPL